MKYQRFWGVGLIALSCLFFSACAQPTPDANVSSGGTESGTPDDGASSSIETANAPPVGLEVGNSAMEIEGNDLAGEAFKLSDYRGKVVLLDFWGDW